MNIQRRDLRKNHSQTNITIIDKIKKIKKFDFVAPTTKYFNKIEQKYCVTPLEPVENNFPI